MRAGLPPHVIMFARSIDPALPARPRLLLPPPQKFVRADQEKFLVNFVYVYVLLLAQ